MKKIEVMSDCIEKEIAEASDYAKCALDMKETDPAIADTYIKIAENHMANMGLLHDQVVSVINEYRKTNGEPPQHMMILYNILHKKHIENAAAVKGMLSLYREP